MTGPTKSKMPKNSGGNNQTPATRRSMSGAGFDFEDLFGAWLMVKMLAGEPAPAIGGSGTKLQAQVDSLGWLIDDFLLTSQGDAGVFGHLAISVKGNRQVTASGLPADFVSRAWELWRDPQSPMNRSNDNLALVTLGKHTDFDETWREVKYACADSDIKSAMSRIRRNRKQSRVFDSVQKPNTEDTIASDEETIELIRRLHVLPLDLQFTHSDDKDRSIAQCRQLLVSGDATEAEKLWNRLINVAKETRLRNGTIKLLDLWTDLRTEFALRNHPDYTRDWETLYNITSDYKARIETELPSGYSVPRADEKSMIETTISTNAVTLVFGESGSGKSALVKNVLDDQFEAWTQVWFAPDDLKTALSAAHRGTLPLGHELVHILKATTSPNNVLVVDSAERIDPVEHGVVHQLFQKVLASTGQVDDRAWRIVVITQTQSWIEVAKAILCDNQAEQVELEPLKSADVKLALLESPSLRWLTGHDDTISALTNLRTLAWMIKAGTDVGPNSTSLTSHAAIADCLWSYWTKGRADVQALMMRLAEREASFERSFALTDLDSADIATFTQRPSELPLQLNQRTNRIEFEHDLAADWARFQFLKQIGTDTTQWAAHAENPLWTNALRMLGQFLIRQPMSNVTEWDVAFASAIGTEQSLAGNILLDALCLDPEAERFLTERTDLLLSDNAKLLNKLLTRFHHIGTVPTNVWDTASSIGLYMETQFRSVVIGRWPPVLRFLIAQREKLSSLVSSALAKIIHTWLTDTPRELSNGSPVPFRRELAEMALAMARTVQVEKGHGVMYLTREPLLYKAPLAGASDLPSEISAWALELAGRRDVSEEVIARIDEILLQKAKKRAERLRTDPEYKAQHEARRKTSPIIGIGREKLPPWPLGARRRIDMDFRDACFKENGLQPLMYASPEVASEVLLALIIEDEPERDYGSSRHEIELGLEFTQDSYPTAFWKSPFFSFLQIDPDTALTAMIALVNFCTERWVAEITDGREGAAPGLELQLLEGEEKIFDGDYQVFDWTQANSMHNGNLFSSLDALEKWFTLQLDAGVDITPYIGRILSDGSSAALVGLLINVGKYSPSLFSGILAPVLTDPYVYFWDNNRVEHVGHNIIGWNWARGGELMYDFARNWTLAPHRQKSLLSVIVDLMLADIVVSKRIQELIKKWPLPDNPKDALEFKLLFASLNHENYQSSIDSETGADTFTFSCPETLSLEAQTWQDENSKPLQYLQLPENCEKLLQTQQAVSDDDAASFYKLLKECTIETAEDESNMARCRIALASTLIVLAENWLARTPEAKENVLSIIRTAISEVASTTQDITNNRTRGFHSDLKFTAYAVMHLWITTDDPALEWETSVLRLLTSGDSGATTTIVSIACINHEQLGAAWWRLLQAGVLWSGLSLLAPNYGDGENVRRVWGVWLARLRRFTLRNTSATVDDLNIERITAGCERLDYYRRNRAYTSGEKRWQGKPERQSGMGLNNHILGNLFYWLINDTGSGNWSEDKKLILRLWTYESERAKANAKEDYGEYSLPSESLGYGLLEKLAILSLDAPETVAQSLWEPVLVHGPEAHYALGHFIRCLFQCLSNGADPAVFELVWRKITEYGLTARWDKPGLWFYGERLICDLLGYGNEDALQKLPSGAALRMRDVYERWAELHLGSDEECITRFCYFLTTEFGASLRFDGLHWIATFLKANNPRNYWYRNGTSDALIELINTLLNQNAQALTSDNKARQALVEITAVLAAKNIPTALALQGRIKQLR